jgi:cell division septum initiation protein DivIVA
MGVMTTQETPSGDQRFYDPTEVEAYVNEVTGTIRTLQARLVEAERRADQAGLPGDQHPETATIGRALLLAGEVADKTIAEADARAAQIVGAAEDRAADIVSAAKADADRMIDRARDAAAEMFQRGEARLLAAVSAFVEGSDILRAELTRIEEDAASWRGSNRATPGTDSPVSSPPPRPDGAAPPAGAVRRLGDRGDDVMSRVAGATSQA